MLSSVDLGSVAPATILITLLEITGLLSLDPATLTSNL